MSGPSAMRLLDIAFPVALLVPLVVLVWPGLGAAQDYVGSEACRTCHEEVFARWQGSHHALAWSEPGEATVRGDFDGATHEHEGEKSRFSVANGDYWIATERPDGERTRYKVHSVAGIAPLQQYLLETAEGQLQAYDVAWDAEQERWYHLYPELDLTPGDGLHWTGPYKNWNARCAACHATGYLKNYDPRSGRYLSTQAEIGVGCEACHGPGEAHLAWTEGKAIEAWPGVTAEGFTIDLGASAEREIQQCAGCHSRREALVEGNPLPGTPYHDAYRLALLRDGLYHADGTILDEVYVYGSFLQSKMYAKGVRCSDCHEVHSAGLRVEGNGLCAQCHSPAGNPEFPSLRKALYDDPAHHFHEPGTAGAQCKNCHMVERVYMGIDGRRDHSFRVPRPDLAAETGAPDACTDCHSDRTPGWAAQQIAAWHAREPAPGSPLQPNPCARPRRSGGKPGGPGRAGGRPRQPDHRPGHRAQPDRAGRRRRGRRPLGTPIARFRSLGACRGGAPAACRRGPGQGAAPGRPAVRSHTGGSHRRRS